MLNRLVAVGVRSTIEQARHIARPGQVKAQRPGNVAFGDDLGFKIQPWRQDQITERGPRLAINAAMLATPVRVDAVVKKEVRRIIAADHTARVFFF